jgi:hypothetical protein
MSDLILLIMSSSPLGERRARKHETLWIPSFAGMTEAGFRFSHPVLTGH